ncbi:hypothetical protein RHGRI_007254 [Rhododendron griersonianum]|uniref:Uncharacterized protein n=1 Tax=Rhododendron griersonianum TaxID=479676 RepID=A0AAV6KZ95_9ERIC|nr:hypothetical protein RHGRI_007254 [Rhododendron griersonianum]
MLASSSTVWSGDNFEENDTYGTKEFICILRGSWPSGETNQRSMTPIKKTSYAGNRKIEEQSQPLGYF